MIVIYRHHGLLLHLQQETMSQLNPFIDFSLFFSFLLLVHSQSSYYPHSISSSTRKNVVYNLYHLNSNSSSTWSCQPEPLNIFNTSDTSSPGMHILFTSKSKVASFACGCYCAENVSNLCYFGILIFPITGVPDGSVPAPQVVWLANRNQPVSANSTLEFMEDGNLALFESDDREIWSTNTGGKPVAGLNLTDHGNLVLFDTNNQVVWQSFDHPTDVLVLGQKLFPGQRLISSASDSNSTEGLYSMVYENGSLLAYIQSKPPQLYYSAVLNLDAEYVIFENGSFMGYTLPRGTTPQLMKLDSDGHLRLYSWSNSGWDEVNDIFHYIDFCNFPMACGKYGICSNAKCSCPVSSDIDPEFFRPVNSRQPNLGCEVSIPISCEYPGRHFLLDFGNLTYFDTSSNPIRKNVDLDKCKEDCLRDCSCKAAIFQKSNERNSRGFCALRNEVFSLVAEKAVLSYEKSAVFLKVQRPSKGSNSHVIIGFPKRKSRPNAVTLGSGLGGFVFLSVLGTCFIIFVKCRKSCKIEEVYLDNVPGMPSRFSYEDLKALTNNFTSKIGEGGFGSVFEGTLKDGEKVAVKRLDGLGLAKRSFLAEVETIGSIHHVNLVRLIGFCAENSHRLLIYEFICNGSLDKWIFRRKKDDSLRWMQRKRIILDTAKGLAYLHEDCRQKIVHLDIKPQNILLDKDFSAKVSDFGLSKLIDKDQSQVVTTLKGTFGYMAPEWLSSVITEKVDVYSFGVTVLEILCGRKNLDWSRPEEDAHLLRVFKKKAENDELQDLVDENGEDMVLNGNEVVEMMKLAAWCLQNDFRRRPSISDVIRVLDGTMEVERDLDYDFLVPPGKELLVAGQAEDVAVLTTHLPSVLSGPR